MKPAIKLMPDYDCWPLWHHGGREVGNIDPSELGLSNALLADLARWAFTYDEHLNRADPASSSWTVEEEKAFESDGLRLAHLLIAEIGSRFSIYYSHRCAPVEVSAENPSQTI